MFDKTKIKAAVTEAIAGKGERKFVQSVDLSVNFRDIDFKKAENRLSIDVTLPAKPKDVKVAVFADGEIGFAAKKVADLVISGPEIDALGKDKKKQKELLSYSMLAVPTLMAAVGKNLGMLLGAKGKLPKPILPKDKLDEVVERARRTVTMRTKGKNLPVVHCIVGTEKMSVDELTDNIVAILDAVVKKVPETNVKDAYVKTTLGKSIKISVQ